MKDELLRELQYEHVRDEAEKELREKEIKRIIEKYNYIFNQVTKKEQKYAN